MQKTLGKQQNTFANIALACMLDCPMKICHKNVHEIAFFLKRHVRFLQVYFLALRKMSL